MSETRKFLTETEIEAFFKAARKTRNGVRDHCMAMMAYRHGFRVSELIDIRLDEIHLDTARLDVRRLKKGLSGHHPEREMSCGRFGHGRKRGRPISFQA